MVYGDAEVQIEDRGETRWIRLNAPQRRNAFDQKMAESIADAVEDASGKRTVVITGVDRSFCAGGSLATLSTPTTAQLRVLYRASGRMFDAIRECRSRQRSPANCTRCPTTGAGARRFSTR